MTKTARVFVILALLALLFIAGFVATKFAATARGKGHEEVTVIRRPNGSSPPPGQPKRETHGFIRNIAPLATVSVSSTESQMGAGVADGVVDNEGWVTHAEMGGAWIKLSWDRPATVIAIELYDLQSAVDNVLSGTLSFDDGSLFPVAPLPPAGSPWRVKFSPNTVHWVTFRIDHAEGRHTGLAEIMVFGMLQ